MSLKPNPKKSDDSDRSLRERPHFESWEVESFHSRLNANRTMFSDAGIEKRCSDVPADKPKA